MAPVTTTTLATRRKSHPRPFIKQPLTMDRVVSIVLGGGAGTRLYPLTETRCKPAIFFGGRYRLIDVPISNALNSGCNKIYILTQFLSASLHQHILKTYRLDTFSPGFIELLTAEQKPSQKEWYQGTADAVRQNLDYFLETPADYFLILAGDQLYHMDYRPMLEFAEKSDADVVVASLPINEYDAKRMGLLKIDQNNVIVDFCEKPQEKELLDRMRLSSSAFREAGLTTVDESKQFLASMGIYLFKRDALFELLQNDPREDFGKHLIPSMVQKGKVAAFLFDGYWEDIGTVEAFYKANIALTQPNPPFSCYSEQHPIYSFRNNLPPPKIFETRVKNSIISEGSVIEAEEVTNSILGPRTVIRSGAIILNSYLMGNEFYEPPLHADHLPEKLEIGENAIIQNAIIDKDCYIGKGVRLVNKNRLNVYDSDTVYIRDGIIVVTRGAHVPDGFML